MFTPRAQLILSGAVVSSSIVVFGSMATRAPLLPLTTEVAYSRTSFEERVSGYMELRRHVVEHVLKHGLIDGDWSDPNVRRTLAAAIQAARRGAQPGDIFGFEVADRIRQAIRVDMTIRHGPDRAAVLDEVPAHTPVHVNECYPDGAPLATMPPLLLMQLGSLPAELQYRFLDDAVILLDVDTNLIIDMVPSVLERRS